MIDRTIDQAEGLRRMFAGRRRVCVTFVSGKGGVGRSSVVLNVAAALAQAGRDALVIDENAGASSLATGLASPPDLGSVIDGASPLEDAVVRLDHRGPTVVRASNAARMLRRAGTPSERSRIASVLEQAVRPYEFVLCDAPVGDAGSFTAWGLESQHIALVLTRATASITEGYGLLKHLRRSFGHRQFLVLVNRVSTEQEARTIFGNMSSLASGSLAASLVFAGYVPPDERLMHARQLRRIAVDAFPQCAAAGAFRAIAEGLQGLPVPRHGPDGDDSTEYARRVVSGIGTAARDDTHTDTTPSTANRSRGMS